MQEYVVHVPHVWSVISQVLLWAVYLSAAVAIWLQLLALPDAISVLRPLVKPVQQWLPKRCRRSVRQIVPEE